MGQTLDKSGADTPLSKMCKDNPQKEIDFRKLSASLNKTLGDEIWPLGGTWNVDKCKLAEEAIWKRDAGDKWKLLMSAWRVSAEDVNLKSRQSNWEHNARRRGIEERDERGTPKPWEVLKYQCKEYDKKRNKDRELRREQQVSGEKEVPPAMSGLPNLFQIPGDETDDERDDWAVSPICPSLPQSPNLSNAANPPSYSFQPQPSAPLYSLEHFTDPIATRTRSQTDIAGSPSRSRQQPPQTDSLRMFPTRIVPNPHGSAAHPTIRVYTPWKPHEMCMIMSQAPNRNTDPEGFIDHIMGTIQMYQANSQDLYSLCCMALTQEERRKWQEALGGYDTWDTFEAAVQVGRVDVIKQALRCTFQQPVDMSKVLECKPTEKEEGTHFWDRFCMPPMLGMQLIMVETHQPSLMLYFSSVFPKR